MLFARILLAATGLMFFIHGLICFIHPATIGIESGLAMPTPGSILEVRAEYGGLPMALGLCPLFYSAARGRGCILSRPWGWLKSMMGPIGTMRVGLMLSWLP